MTIDGNPRLAWGPYPTGSVIYGYNIYRSVNGGAFSYIGNVSSTTYEYKDFDYGYDPQGIQLQYYIKARLNSSATSLSSASNTVTTTGLIIGKEITQMTEDFIFSLSNNYPNPFNPSTLISYELPKDCRVTIKVYDILGNEVRTLVNEQKSSGKYSIEFNANDLVSGTYIYRIQAGEYTASRKMILLK